MALKILKIGKNCYAYEYGMQCVCMCGMWFSEVWFYDKHISWNDCSVVKGLKRGKSEIDIQ